MKKFKVLAVIAALFCCTTVYAKDFDWSQCWCNYGGGIEKGDFIVNVDAGLYYLDFAYSAYSNYWFIPPVMVEVQYAQPIWKLPFTFGGYASVRGYGYKAFDHYDSSLNPVYKDQTYFALAFGGEAAYHVQLPPEGLDVYAVTRIGANIPFVHPTSWVPDYVSGGFNIGANWFFTDNFGLNLELGAPYSKFGVTFKF